MYAQPFLPSQASEGKRPELTMLRLVSDEDYAKTLPGGQKAAARYRKAAEQGDANAQFNLGVCYNQGQGVDKDPKAAVAWYRKAAEQEPEPEPE